MRTDTQIAETPEDIKVAIIDTLNRFDHATQELLFAVAVLGSHSSTEKEMDLTNFLKDCLFEVSENVENALEALNPQEADKNKLN